MGRSGQPTRSRPGSTTPGVGPEHSFYADAGLAEYVGVDDQEALEGFKLLSQLEGILPALESAHAIAYAAKLAPEMSPEQVIVINLSGRGDKDVVEVMRVLEERSATRPTPGGAGGWP